jgi:hypothetical protein
MQATKVNYTGSGSVTMRIYIVLIITVVCMGQSLNIWGNDKLIIEDGIVYGDGGGVAMKLDLARPVGEGPFPALIILHGGGWGLGSRSEC